jgi:hypothetical protein
MGRTRFDLKKFRKNLAKKGLSDEDISDIIILIKYCLRSKKI